MKTVIRSSFPKTLAILIILPLALLMGCSEEGPAENMGERIDDAVQDTRDAFNPPGPAERMGREIDDSVEEITDN